MRLHREFIIRRAGCLAAVLAFTILPAVPIFAKASTPVVLNSRGYINSAPLMAHTTTAFNSNGASTLVAFVSSHPQWNGQPVMIGGLSDNSGNTWKLLTGPTPWTGGSFTLLSAIYYVNAPVTTATHRITVNLTNPAPLVVHVVAVSGADITGPPLYSGFANPDAGRVSTEATSKPITVPTGTLLLGWAKNESKATASALGGYALDPESTGFLWGESQNVHAAGVYRSHFRFDTAVGWQTAVVGLKLTTAPLVSSQAVTTDDHAPVGITLSSFSPRDFPLAIRLVAWPAHGALSGSAPNLIYAPDAGYTGPDAFTFEASDGAAVSNTATVAITVRSRTFFQRLRESTLKIGIFSSIWGIAIGVMLPLKKRDAGN